MLNIDSSFGFSWKGVYRDSRLHRKRFTVKLLESVHVRFHGVRRSGKNIVAKDLNSSRVKYLKMLTQCRTLLLTAFSCVNAACSTGSCQRRPINLSGREAGPRKCWSIIPFKQA
jgi:hypothetical protein